MLCVFFGKQRLVRFILTLLCSSLDPAECFQQHRDRKIADFKRRMQLEIKERKDKEEAHQAAHKKKRSDERLARRATILRFWGQRQVRSRS